MTAEAPGALLTRGCVLPSLGSGAVHPAVRFRLPSTTPLEGTR